MSYEPAHDYWIGFAEETGTVTESSNGTTAAALPSAPASYALCGYTSVPEQVEGLNNSVKYAIGKATGAYRAKGARNPSFTLMLRGPGALDLLALTQRTSDVLPRVCFWIGIPGVETHRIRFCKLGAVTYTGSEAAQGEASEIQVQIEVTGMAWEDVSSAVSPDLETLQAALTQPLYWHDVRTLTIENASGTPTDYRGSVAGFTLSVNHNLTRSGQRPYWGDNAALANSNYYLREGVINVTGEIQFHGLIGRANFTGAANAQTWGDFEIAITDSPSTQEITLTAINCIPTLGRQISAADAGAELGYRIPFAAEDYTVVAQLVEEE